MVHHHANHLKTAWAFWLCEPIPMLSLLVTPEEVERGEMHPDHLKAAVEAVRADGFVILQNVVDPAHLDILRERMQEDVEALIARDDPPYNWNTGNLQQEPPPFPPYLFRDILLNDMAIAVTQAILGPGLKNSIYSGNTSMPSINRQPVHASGHLWPNLAVAHPPYSLVINIPAMAMSPENGSTEIWPGSHLDTTTPLFDDIKIPEAKLAQRRETAPPIQPIVPLGSLIIRDLRLWHAGMPNSTDRPRPMILMVHSCSWWPTSSLTFPKGTEAFFADSPLRTHATFTDEPIDYIRQPQAYEYTR